MGRGAAGGGPDRALEEAALKAGALLSRSKDSAINRAHSLDLALKVFHFPHAAASLILIFIIYSIHVMYLIHDV